MSTVAGALVAALGLATVTACDSIDPTAQSFPLTFTNDLGVPVHLKLCSDGGCRHFDYSDGWKVGAAHEENISDRDLFTRWLIEADRSKRVLGCLPLRFDQKYDDVRVRLSQLVPCPGAAPIHVHHGRGRGRS